MTALVDIEVWQNRKLIQNKQVALRDLKYYIDEAEQTVVSLASRYSLDVTLLLKNEDFVSHMATALMVADTQWDGTGTIQGYRYAQASWCLKKFIKRNKIRCDRAAFSINTTDNEDKPIIQIASSYEDSTLDQLSTQEQIDDLLTLIETNIITASERKCIKLYYLKQLTCQQIGHKIGVSKQMVSLNLVNARKKLQGVVREH